MKITLMAAAVLTESIIGTVKGVKLSVGVTVIISHAAVIIHGYQPADRQRVLNPTGIKKIPALQAVQITPLNFSVAGNGINQLI